MKTILAWIPVYVAAAGVAEMNPKPDPSGAGADTLRLDSCWLAEAEDSAAADQDMTVAAPQDPRNTTYVAREDPGGFWFELIGAFINGAARELFEKPSERPSRDRGVRRETNK